MNEKAKRLKPTVEVLRELYLKSGNQCAFPGCYNAMVDDNGNFIGQICHIEAAEAGGERFNPNMTNEERRSFDNLMLMCYEHHVVTRQINAGYQKEILEACKKKIKAENRAGSLYNDYADGILSESDYLYAKEKYLSEAAAEEQRIIELQEMQRRYEKGRKENSKLETIVEQYKNFDNLTENIIKSFISKVLVYSDERLEICRVKAKLPMAANM